MRIAVVDVPSDRGGALVKLLNFYTFVKEQGQEHEWHFIVSIPYIKPCDHIRVYRADHTRKGWPARIRWELLQCPDLLRCIAPDVVLSLQNLKVLYRKVPQVLYIHQSLPFTDRKRFSFFRKEELVLAVYQRVIGCLIRWSARKADHIIVQTQWMKTAVSGRIPGTADRIDVVPPHLKLPEGIDADWNSNPLIDAFFYPAGASGYKNHDVILDALLLLKRKGRTPLTLFTLTGEENAYARRLKEKAGREGLNVLFAGSLPQAKVFETYRHSALLFPSYIETVGFPLIEARMVGAPVISARTPFAGEALDGYARAYWFDTFSPEEMACRMEECLERKYEPLSPEMEAAFAHRYSLDNTWRRMMELAAAAGTGAPPDVRRK